MKTFVKKVFQYDYPDENIQAIEKWLKKQLINERGEIGIFRPTIIVEVIDED